MAEIRRMDMELTTVGIWKPIHVRLRRYRQNKLPRPSMADLVSLAVQEYLDRQERSSALGR